MKSNTNKYYLLYLQSYFSPQLLPKIAIYTFKLSKTAQLLNFLYHLKLHSQSKISSENAYLKYFQEQIAQKQSKNINKKNLSKNKELGVREELNLCLRAFGIYEERFKDLKSLIIIAENQKNINNQSVNACEECIEKLFNKLQNISLVVCIRPENGSRDRNFMIEGNLNRIQQIKQLEEIKSKERKNNYQKNSKPCPYLMNHLTTDPAKADYYILINQKKKLAQKMNNLRRAYTEITNILARMHQKVEKENSVDNSQFSGSEEENIYQENLLKSSKQQKISRKYNESKATITSRSSNNNNKWNCEALSNYSNNNISIKNHLVTQRKKQRYRASIETSALNFYFSKENCGGSPQRRRRANMIKFTEPNDDAGSGRDQTINYEKSKLERRSNKSRKQTNFFLDIKEETLKGESRGKSKQYSRSYSHINIQKTQAGVSKEKISQNRIKSERKVFFSESINNGFLDMLKSRMKHRDAILTNCQLAEYSQGMSLEQLKKISAQKHKIRFRNFRNLSKHKKKMTTIKPQPKVIERGSSNMYTHYRNTSKKYKRSILKTSPHPPKKYQEKQNQPTILHKNLSLPKRNNIKQHSSSTIKSLALAQSHENEDFDKIVESIEKQKKVLPPELPQRFTLTADSDDLLNFQERYVRFHEKKIFMKEKLLEKKQYDHSEQEWNFCHFSWGNYKGINSSNFVKLEQVQLKEDDEVQERHNQAKANIKIFKQENLKLNFSRRLISASNALKQHSITQQRIKPIQDCFHNHYQNYPEFIP